MSKIDIKNFVPLKDTLVVEITPKKLETDSGIITHIHRNPVTDRQTNGIVISQGPECKYNLIGKRVYFDCIRGKDIDENHVLLLEETLLGFES